jgi:putative ABC transport system permease protein
MLLNYLKIAWRNLRRNPVFALISIAGLTLGSCICLVVWLVCSYEFSFDTFHPNRERIYRLTSRTDHGGKELRWPRVLAPVPAALRKKISGVDAITDISSYDGKSATRSPGGPLHEFDDGLIVITDTQYFTIFQYDWLGGNPAAAMTDPFHVVLTESRARQYFGVAAPEKWLGKEVIYGDSLRVTVSGIVNDWKGRTDFPFTDFISFSTIKSSSYLDRIYRPEDWQRTHHPGVWCFALLSKRTPPARIDTQLQELAAADPDRWSKMDLKLEPLADIHFNTGDAPGDDIRKAHLPALYGMIGIAIFILLIAAINFINLSTAQSIRRAKEIGVRKVLGSSKTNLILQFLTETSLLSFTAVLVGLLMTRPVLYWFGDYIPAGMPMQLFSFRVLGFSLLLAFITSLLAGFYPAVVLSSFLPVVNLKGTGTSRGGPGKTRRKVLIVFQFSIALLFIMTALLIGKQIRFMLQTDLGFSSKAILTMETPWRDSIAKAFFLKERIGHIPGVDAVITEGAHPMAFSSTTSDTLEYKDKPAKVAVFPEAANEEFIPFYHMHLLAGRNLIHSDSLREFLVNETAAHRLGFLSPDSAVGKFLYWRGRGHPIQKGYPICGVVADFYQQSFREPIKPLFLGNIPEFQQSIAVRVNPANLPSILAAIRKIWKTVYPDHIFGYDFIDNEIAAYYDNEQKTARLLQVATLTAIFISCMGLFGLALFITRQRTKEIAIRKVLGAGVRQILALLTADFIKPVALAFCIAIPVSILAMHQWLQQFAYRTSINIFIFLLTAVIILVFALATISVQTIRSAAANPIDGLREA